jgi:hypothetical protein
MFMKTTVIADGASVPLVNKTVSRPKIILHIFT